MGKRKQQTVWQRALAAGWNYSGDTHLECGGLYWKWDGGPDYVSTVRITPCSDAGGPDNLFEVEAGSIFLPQDNDTRWKALDSIGWGPQRDFIGPYELGRLVDAFLGYYGTERDVYAPRIVRIGGPDKFWTDHRGGWNPDPDTILPGNAQLENYVHREFL